MNYNEMLTYRRSVRKYEDKPVSTETVQEMIKESTLAPNAGNEQPWEFTIVSNREMLKNISDECKKNMLERIEANANDYAKKYQNMLQNDSFNVFYNAPCVIFIFGQIDLKNLYVDCALAAGYFMMAATSRGLGTCWINFGTEIKHPEMRRELGLADNSRIIAPITLGHPVKVPAVPNRKAPKIVKIIR